MHVTAAPLFFGCLSIGPPIILLTLQYGLIQTLLIIYIALVEYPHDDYCYTQTHTHTQAVASVPDLRAVNFSASLVTLLGASSHRRPLIGSVYYDHRHKWHNSELPCSRHKYLKCILTQPSSIFLLEPTFLEAHWGMLSSGGRTNEARYSKTFWGVSQLAPKFYRHLLDRFDHGKAICLIPQERN